MIAFVSLFLGLVVGSRPIEVTVGESVARVEIRLDGESFGVLEGAPWVVEGRFGDELIPRHLEAVAFDLGGDEVGRVSQWLNLPQPRASVNVLLGPVAEDGTRIARLSWESAAGAEPESVSATLDGERLAVADPRRLELPAVDERQLHLLQVELGFENRVTSRVDLTYGGAYADEVSTEITALALLADSPTRPGPGVKAAKGWFQARGEPLEVLAVEKESAEVVFVLDRPFPHFVPPTERYKPQRELALAPDLRLRFMSTKPKLSEGVSTDFQLFPISPDYGKEVGDLYWLLSGILRPPESRPPQPAMAVAVAGLSAYEGRHRRAVVLVPSVDPPDDDVLTQERVRRYLERLGVPLVVWNPKKMRSTEHLEPWGEVMTVASFDQLGDAYAELVELLDRQWIVWIDGRHLPQDIRLAASVEGFRLLSSEPSSRQLETRRDDVSKGE